MTIYRVALVAIPRILHPPLCPHPTSHPLTPHHHPHSPRSNVESLKRRPTNMGYVGARTFPAATIDNWAAAYKVREHFEEQTERRKAAGKPIY